MKKTPGTQGFLFRACGGRRRTRTFDPLIKSQLLYQLSYAPRPTSWASGASTDSDKSRAQQDIGAKERFATKQGFAQSKACAQKESRRVGTRRLPYVGDRVGGLGVRPPALAPIYGNYSRSAPGCSICVRSPIRSGPHRWPPSRCPRPCSPWL